MSSFYFMADEFVSAALLDAGSYKVKSNRLDGLGIGDADDDSPYGWAAFSGKAGFRQPGLENEGKHTFLAYVENHNDQGCNQDPFDEFWSNGGYLNMYRISREQILWVRG